MNDAELHNFREQLEREFLQLVNRGDDIRYFLYFPHTFLSPLVKQHLDEFLMKEAYSKIEAGNLTPEIFVVYEDSLITVKLDETPQRVELLQRLLEFFTKTEEFEKCTKIHTLLTKIAA